MKKKSIWYIFTPLLFSIAAVGVTAFFVAESGNSGTYILDRTGERWDISQAESIGFKPGKFQYGIGRDAFTPLDDSDLEPAETSTPANLRVIGVAAGSDAQAYSVSRLSRHETANTTLNAKPIVVAY
jgi:hypothetical protein